MTKRRLVLGHGTDAFGPPNGLELMARYAEAFHKVLVDHRDELIAYTRAQTTEIRATLGTMPQIDYSESREQ